MEPEVSLSFWKDPAPVLYPESEKKISSHSQIYSFRVHFNIIL
jgi:hypothetical protein